MKTTSCKTDISMHTNSSTTIVFWALAYSSLTFERHIQGQSESESQSFIATKS